MNTPKPNKWPSTCHICGTRFQAFQGTVIFEAIPSLTRTRGRPPGRFLAFCTDHYKEACEALERTKGNQAIATQEAPKPVVAPPTNNDATTLSEAFAKAMENNNNKDNVTPTEKKETAETIAELLLKLSNVNAASINPEEVKKLIAQAIVDNDLVNGETVALAIEKAVKDFQQVPATKLEIKNNGVITYHDIGMHHYMLPDVLLAVSQGLNVYLVGPAGSGKTTMADQIAKALNKSFYFTGAVDTKYALIGFRDAHGNYHRTPFREAFEHGGVFLFDEVDASSASAILSFNAALANGHMDFPDGIVTRHPDFVAIAAANTFGNGADRVYVGRNQLDGATLDRFVTLEMDYDPKLEKALAGNDDWVSQVQKTRKAVRDLSLRYVISPRASIQGAKLLAAGMAKDKVEKAVLYRSMKPEDVAKVVNAVRYL